MSLPRSLRSVWLLPIVALCLAESVGAQPRIEDERAEVVRQLNESRDRTKKLEERLRLLDARRAQPSAAAPARIAANCSTMPFFIDPEGVKRLRPECLVSEPEVSCEVNPFSIDDQGIKRVRPACTVPH